MHGERADIVARVCKLLEAGDSAGATRYVKETYPFESSVNRGRRYSALQMTRVFLRDGFIDRYSGRRLVFPGVLHLLSVELGEAFPAHPNWKMTVTHPAYWELSPTIDHVVPVSRGGKDDESNWVTTSMLRNSAKSNWLLEELGWQLHAPGDPSRWDGLLRWFLTYTDTNPIVDGHTHLRRWSRVGRAVLRPVA